MWLTARALILSLMGIVPLAQVQTSEPPKKLQIVNNVFDFGTVPQNSTLTQFFWFKAVGADTVKITEIQTGCDCTTIPLERQWLAPGDSMYVGVFWDTQRKVGNAGRYPYIWIDGQQESERIFLKAEVALYPDSARPISIKPFKAELSKMGSLSVDSVKVMLTSRVDVPLKLSIVSPPSPEYTVQTPDTLPAGGTGSVVITVASGFATTEFVRSVTIAYDGAKDQHGRFTIPIRRKIIA